MKIPSPPYFQRYINQVPEGNILTILTGLAESTHQFLQNLPEEKGNYAYATGKWTIKEVIGHLCDAERVFAYRALRFARNDSTPLPSFEQDDYVANASFSSCPLQDIAEEFFLIRKANIALFRTFNAEVLKRKGIASDYEISVEALLYCIAGHELHHLKVIKEKYL